MKAVQLVVTTLYALAEAISSQAHDIDAIGKIEVACAGDTVRMGAIDSAVHDNHYWAPQTARRQMLAFARQACARGAKIVTFAPPDDQRPCRTPPTWSTLCIDQAATEREGADPRFPAPSSQQE